MTEIMTEQFKVTAAYERKVNLGNYESETFTAWVSVPLAPSQAADPVVRMQALDAAFEEARAGVNGSMGGSAPAPSPQPVATQPVNNPQPVAAQPVPAPIAAAFPGATAMPQGPSAEHVQYLLDNGLHTQIGETYYDNRADLGPSGNRPHFKDIATKQISIWPLKDSPAGAPRYA